MPSTTTTTRSNDAPRLLRTLCNHWRHKFEIRRDDDTHAFIPFVDAGQGADFRVHGETLRIVLALDDAGSMTRYQGVIENHLQRFARDETLAFDWQTA
ncbi:DUF2218 domain-containing protein [Luteimonas deserti]|uniref:DUF2218 domain-containing protein n=1 Tax=Luteimonas deserti TaxID=2752306 RepID=A0A7Z0TV09_9GAMM|nr:DUF2218 domain-containing protein [Luteimonas deserti]NYZ63396.1 DUF2218 domain-containing protein [Luteimonas deserti]